MEVTARNLKGVTIKDALDAIHKAYKKRVGVQFRPIRAIWAGHTMRLTCFRGRRRTRQPLLGWLRVG